MVETYKATTSGRSPQEMGWRGEEREGRSQQLTAYYEAQGYFIRKGRTIAKVLIKTISGQISEPPWNRLLLRPDLTDAPEDYLGR
jgi:hypothetical protein